MVEHQIFNTLVEFFEEDEWDFQWVEGMSVLSMGFSGKNGKWTCYAQARETQQQLVFYSVLPVNVPEASRMKMAEFLTRANYGMIIGNFELDFADGEVRYKTSVDVEGSELAMPLIRQMVYANIIITDRYFPGIMQVIYSNILPEDALRQIEQPDDAADPQTPTAALAAPPQTADADREEAFTYLDDDEDFFDDDDEDDDFFGDDDDILDDDEPSANGSSPAS